MLDRDLTFMIAGAAITLVSSVVTMVLLYFFLFGANNLKRDQQEKRALPAWLIEVKERREREARARRDQDKRARPDLWDWLAKLKAWLMDWLVKLRKWPEKEDITKGDGNGQQRARLADWLAKVGVWPQRVDNAKRDGDKQEKGELPSWLVKVKAGEPFEAEDEGGHDKRGDIMQKFVRWLNREQ